MKSKPVRFGRVLTELWSNLHTMGGVFMIGLLSIQLLLHWGWMVNTASQFRNQPPFKANEQVIASGGL